MRPHARRLRNFAGCAISSIAAPAWSSPRPKRYYRRAAGRRTDDGDRLKLVRQLFRAPAHRRDGEIEQFINAFTVNETYFYREDHQLRCLTNDLLADRVRTKPARTKRYPHLVGALFDRRGALFDRHLAAGELAAGRCLRHRDRRLGHRHRGAGSGAVRVVFGKRALMRLPPGADRQIFLFRRRRAMADRRRPAPVGAVRAGQPRRCRGDRRVRPLRCDLLPQRADLLRRRLAPHGGGKPLRKPAAGRVHLSGPHGIHEPDLAAVRSAPVCRRHRLSAAGRRRRDG